MLINNSDFAVGHLQESSIFRFCSNGGYLHKVKVLILYNKNLKLFMKKIYMLFQFFLVVVLVKAQSEKPINIMLVTGGHAYDTIQFFQMFDSLDGITYTHFAQPKANEAIAGGEAEKFDVLVFYDMWQDISEAEKNAYIKLTKEGKPFLFLHHSLVSYQNWPMFEKMLGGKYVEKSPDVPVNEQSTYEHDVWVYIRTAQNHPITRGLGELRFFDEVYGNFRVSDDVIPLLKTTHPKSTPLIGWENVFNSSKIVYIQPGHDYRTFETEDYRKLLTRAIRYLAQSK